MENGVFRIPLCWIVFEVFQPGTSEFGNRFKMYQNTLRIAFGRHNIETYLKTLKWVRFWFPLFAATVDPSSWRLQHLYQNEMMLDRKNSRNSVYQYSLFWLGKKIGNHPLKFTGHTVCAIFYGLKICLWIDDIDFQCGDRLLLIVSP